MAKTRTYPNAPITEAIIQLLVKPAQGISLTDLAHAHEGEEKSYPDRKDLQLATGLFEMGPRVSAAASAQHIGFMYSSSDQKQVYQTGLEGFSFIRLAPYESWHLFNKEAGRLWQKYRERLKPTAVTRLAVRYVNRLDLPGPHVETKDYLRTQPEIAADLPQALAGYFMHLQIPMEDIRCMLLINETIGASPKSGCVGLILDIDVFRTDDIPQDEGGIWQMFETLRVRKNEIFEACITDRARELFQ
jgi:uncharacterized protein (TIGR04255 family)